MIMRIAALLMFAAACGMARNPFAGRWDITITTPNGAYPGWMEVVEKDGGIQVRVQPRSGSVRPAREAKIDGSRLIVPMGGGARTVPQCCGTSA